MTIEELADNANCTTCHGSGRRGSSVFEYRTIGNQQIVCTDCCGSGVPILHGPTRTSAELQRISLLAKEIVRLREEIAKLKEK